MMHLQENVAPAIAVLGIVAVGPRLPVHPSAQMIALGDDAQGKPFAILDTWHWSASARNAKIVDAPGGIVPIKVVALSLVARRVFLAEVSMWLATKVYPAVAPGMAGIENSDLCDQFKVCKFSFSGEITLASLTIQDSVFNLPAGLMSEAVLAPACQIAAVEELDPIGGGFSGRERTQGCRKEQERRELL
jgi:hypothetical protein